MVILIVTHIEDARYEKPKVQKNSRKKISNRSEIPVRYNQMSLSATYSSITCKQTVESLVFEIVAIGPRFLTCYLLVLAVIVTVVWIALINCNSLILTICYTEAKLYFILRSKIKLKYVTKVGTSLQNSQCIKHRYLQYLDSDVGRQMARDVCNCR